jgi:flagellar biosynthesis/type III secretory pathway protein FliH
MLTLFFGLGLIAAVVGWHAERQARRIDQDELSLTRALLRQTTAQRDSALADRQRRYEQGVSDGRQLGYDQAERERIVREAREIEAWEGETVRLYDMPLAA